MQTLLRGGSGGTFPPESWPFFLGRGAEAGIRSARFEALWNWAEAARPQGNAHNYDWARQDDVVAAMARAGMRWKAVLAFLPAWAFGPSGGFPAEYHDDFAAYAAAVAARYGPGGTFWAQRPELPTLPVVEYAVWTEPNSANYWQTTQDAAEYESVYRRLRAAIKAVDPAAEVLVSLGWQDFDGYLRRMRAAAGDAWAIDGVAFHPYAPTPVGIVSLVRTLRATLVEVGSGGVPIHLWEVGWSRVPSGPGAAHSWDGRIADEPRAANLTLTSDGLMRSDCGVSDFVPYSLVEKQVDPDAAEQWFGLFNVDGSATATMRAWAASVARFRGEGGRRRLDLCGDRAPSPTQPLLPLELRVSLTSQGCVSADVSYDGYPVEDASVRFRGEKAGEGGANTDTSGRAAFCVPQQARGSTYSVQASVTRLAESVTLSCKGLSCRVIDPAAACVAPRIVVTPRARLTRGRVRVRVGLRCRGSWISGRRLRVYGVSPAGRRKLLRTVGTRRTRVRMTVRPRAPFTKSLVLVFAGVRRLNLAPAQARILLRR